MDVSILEKVVGLTSDLYIVALTVFREARGEPHEGQMAVARVILNRVTDKAGRWPKSAEGVCLQPFQFSCWNPADPNYKLYPDPNHYGKTFRDCILAVLEAAIGDPTDGANHYVNLDVAQPTWISTMTQTVKIGAHTFFRA